jgi:hypothetical protein
MSDKYFIIAGNAREAEYYIIQKMSDMYTSGNTSITRSHFIYVSDVVTLKGFSNPTGWFVGTWRDRNDIDQIILQLFIAKTGSTMTNDFRQLLKEYGLIT